MSAISTADLIENVRGNMICETNPDDPMCTDATLDADLLAEVLCRLERSISQTQPTAGEPSAWVVVPRVPTEEIVSEICCCMSRPDWTVAGEQAWRAAIFSAPAPVWSDADIERVARAIAKTNGAIRQWITFLPDARAALAALVGG